MKSNGRLLSCVQGRLLAGDHCTASTSCERLRLAAGANSLLMFSIGLSSKTTRQERPLGFSNVL